MKQQCVQWRYGTVVAIATLAVAALAGCGSTGGHGRPASTAGSGTVSATTRSVSFVTAGTTTYGTLEIPRHRNGQRLAAALLIPGSGPTDRDGNQPPNLLPNTLKLIADALGKQGIMTLRYDKYFTGKTGVGAANPASTTLNDFIRQADAGYQLLSKQASADPQRLLVVGHSEGGMYALEVADSVTPHPAGLALVEPQDERFLDLVNLQDDQTLQQGVAQGQINSATAASNTTAISKAIAAFRAHQPVSVSGILPPINSGLAALLIGTNATYDRTDDAVYPPDIAAKLPHGTRVLVTDGTGDTNVPPSTIGPLVKALSGAGSTGPGLRTLPGLDHYLHPAGTAENDSILAQSFRTALHDWATPYAAH